MTWTSERKYSLIAAVFAALLLTVASGCNGFFVNPKVTGVTVSPATSNLQVSGTRQLTAIANNNDGSTTDVTGTALWDSDNPTVVSVSATGLVKALQNTNGAVTITATYKGFSGTATTTVGQTITITCSSCSSNSISLSANGNSGSSITLSSNVAANWTSGSSAIISVSGSNTTAPTATLGGTTGTVTITATGTSGGSGTLQITVTQ